MRHVRLFAVAAFAVFALTGVASASASAAQWYLKGVPLKGSEEVSQTTKVEEGIEFAYYGNPKGEGNPLVIFKCSTLTGEPSRPFEIVAPAALKFGDLQLAGCKVTYPKSQAEQCKFREGVDFGTAPLTSTIGRGTGEEEDKGTLAPVSGEIFAEWGGELGGCVAEVVFKTPTKGSIPIKLPTGRLLRTEQPVVFEKAAGLTWNGTAKNLVYMTGKVKLKLVSGSLYNLF